MEQLRALLRSSGCYSLKNAKHMIMETGGQVSLTTYNDKDDTLSLLLVNKERIEKKVLENHQLDEQWLVEKLKQLGYLTVDNVAYAEWSQDKGFYVIRCDDLLADHIRLDG
ncbi:YetF domain-containing protein [Fundicoccus sp. Sow4_F4]|uniref:YetF domain-containing protein n=1 Tax=Fundicoccus sp. Sow4_F4 TaxID=3438783 RepID=UPI003F909455